MRLVVLFLNKEEFLNEILEAMVELDIPGATVVDSVGMGRILAHDIPIFAGFQNLLNESRPGNKIIFSTVPENKIDALVREVEHVVGPLDEPGNGLLITLPVDRVVGLPKKAHP
ncbi:MAG TPA: hypothetical protein ENJ89_01190 [Caldithrix abyssi]|uniref:P-II family nitrogen regulator n=1 Tax=Caldithrix abyssi TaxID=187145 RepID=A0A7V5PN08_CALAY|nr:hypothetical protein [Caldithrix abyssi]